MQKRDTAFERDRRARSASILALAADSRFLAGREDGGAKWNCSLEPTFVSTVSTLVDLPASVDPTSHQVRKVIFSSDGELGNHATMRPFESVLVEPGDIEIRPYTPGDQTRQAGAVLLGHAARIFRNGRDIGRLSGLDIEPSGNLEGVIGGRLVDQAVSRFRLRPGSFGAGRGSRASDAAARGVIVLRFRRCAESRT